jgi:hypothetical protein
MHRSSSGRATIRVASATSRCSSRVPAARSPSRATASLPESALLAQYRDCDRDSR